MNQPQAPVAAAAYNEPQVPVPIPSLARNNPTQPTCKVVTIPGQRGARIYPKGCKVRWKVNNNEYEKYSKATGQKKPKKTSITTGGSEFMLRIKFPDVEERFQNRTLEFAYDTGAESTNMSRIQAIHMGLLDRKKSPDFDNMVISDAAFEAGVRFGKDTQSVNANNTADESTELIGVRMLMPLTGEIITDTILVGEDDQPLFGAESIQQTKQLKVKFRQGAPEYKDESGPADQEIVDWQKLRKQERRKRNKAEKKKKKKD